MLNRRDYLERLSSATRRSPITALLGPRQCGKTTLARMFVEGKEAAFFDLESYPDRQRLQNPELVLGSIEGLIILDEIQNLPSLFTVLRVLVDRPDNRALFLILGSASPAIIKTASETLAGRVEFIELSGFDLSETGKENWKSLWLRGGFPRAFLAKSGEDSLTWREGFIRTFLERDIPQLGINIPAVAMRRFWTMLAHYQGGTWNASELGRSMGLSDKTVRSYLDILTGTFMVRQLQPWLENLGKRQVKSPKIYLRDSGILHSLLNIPDWHSLLGHPKIGASWEGFVVEEVLQTFRPSQAYFWATHSGSEIDLVFSYRGYKLGVEVKFNEAPRITKSMRTALADLVLDQLWIIYPGQESYPAAEKISVWSILDIDQLPGKVE
ncbi:MAG: ATP-binding protein [Chloroflexota bacterium]|nr:ATP-binding protein [Chloroflexota bacterium]